LLNPDLLVFQQGKYALDMRIAVTHAITRVKKSLLGPFAVLQSSDHCARYRAIKDMFSQLIGLRKGDYGFRA
jgi:hypothetical protein